MSQKPKVNTFYEVLDHDPTMEFAQKVSAAICELRAGNHISVKMPSNCR